MDILFLIKAEQDRVLELAEAFLNAAKEGREFLSKNFEDFFHQIHLYMGLDEEFLQPEISELFDSAIKLIALGETTHKQVKKKLQTLKPLVLDGSGGEKKLIIDTAESLNEEVISYIQAQQEQIFPRMREMIPTQEREDLSDIFLDIKEELNKLSDKKLSRSEAII